MRKPKRRPFYRRQLSYLAAVSFRLPRTVIIVALGILSIIISSWLPSFESSPANRFVNVVEYASTSSLAKALAESGKRESLASVLAHSVTGSGSLYAEEKTGQKVANIQFPVVSKKYSPASKHEFNLMEKLDLAAMVSRISQLLTSADQFGNRTMLSVAQGTVNIFGKLLGWQENLAMRLNIAGTFTARATILGTAEMQEQTFEINRQVGQVAQNLAEVMEPVYVDAAKIVTSSLLEQRNHVIFAVHKISQATKNLSYIIKPINWNQQIALNATIYNVNNNNTETLKVKKSASVLPTTTEPSIQARPAKMAVSILSEQAKTNKNIETQNQITQAQPEVLGASITTVSPEYINQLVDSRVNQYLAEIKIEQRYVPVAYYQPAPAANFTGGSLAGVTVLSSQSLISDQATINQLTISGQANSNTINTTNLNVSGTAILQNIATTTVSSLILSQPLQTASGGLGFNASTVAKGEIITGTENGILGVQAIGADGLCLMASSTSATGLEWQSCAVASGAITTINGLSAADQNFIASSTGSLVFNISSVNATHVFAIQSAPDYTIPLTSSTTEWTSKVSSQWVTNGSNIYYNSGNVGVGLINPDSLFQVAGDIRVGVASATTGQIILQNSSNGYSSLIKASSTQIRDLVFTLPNTTGTSGQAVLTDGNGGLYFGAGNNGSFMSGVSDPGKPAVPTLVHSGSVNNSMSIAANSNVTAGNVLIVNAYCQNATVVSLSDSLNTVWTKVVSRNAGAVFVGTAADSGADIFTFSGSGSCGYMSMSYGEVSGSNGVVDASQSNASPSVPSVTTTVQNDLLILAGTAQNCGSWVAGSPAVSDSYSCNPASSIGHMNTSVTGTYSPSYYNTPGGTGVGFTLALEPIPVSSPGNNGDYYLNRNTGILWGPKTNDSWDVAGVGFLLTQGGTTSGIVVSSGGNVGIGTSTPVARLSVTGAPTIDSFNISSSSGISLFRVTQSGNIGIGTTSPLQKLTLGSGNELVANGWLCVTNGDNCAGISSPVAGTVYAVGSYTTGADVAENYPTLDATLEAGDLVAADAENSVYVVKATSTASIVGIISTKPGVLLNGYNPDKFTTSSNNTATSSYTVVPVALSGRVPVKVSNENGDIQIGDYLTASKLYPGYAMKATEAGIAVGRALQEFKSLEKNDQGKILVLAGNAYYQPKVASLLQNTQNSVDATTQWMASLVNLNMTNASVFGNIVVTGSVAVQRDLHVGGVVYAATLKADALVAKEKICIGETCVTEDQLKALLQLISGPVSASGSGSAETTDEGGSVAGASTEANDSPASSDISDSSSSVSAGSGAVDSSDSNSASGASDTSDASAAGSADVSADSSSGE